MHKIKALTAIFLLVTLNLYAQTGVKKGPPDLSGNWIIKNSDGSIKRHFTAIQTGNFVKFQCTDMGETGRVYTFNWDVPGNYVLLGKTTGIRFDKTSYEVTIKEFYKKKYSAADLGTTIYFTKNGLSYRMDEYHLKEKGLNFNTTISFGLCETNSFAAEARFTVAQTLDNIHINAMSVYINAPEPSLEPVMDVDGKTPVISGSATTTPSAVVTARLSAGHCAEITYSNYYNDSWDLVKVKDNW